MKSEVKRYLLIFPGIFTLVFYIISLSRIGFTSDDESATYTSRFLHDNSILEASRALAKGTGRFYQEIFFTLSQIPYLVPKENLLLSIGLNRSIQVSVFVISVYWFMSTIFDRKIIFLSLSLMIFTIDLGGWYNALVSYPLWLSYGFSATFISAGLLSSYLKRPHKLTGLLFLTVAVFSLLSYESHLFDLVLYIFVMLKHANFGQRDFFTLIKRIKHLIAAYFTFLFVYLAIYWNFKSTYQGNYSGSEIGTLQPDTVVGTLLRESFRHTSIKYYLSTPLYGINIDPLSQFRNLFGGDKLFVLIVVIVVIFLKFMINTNQGKPRFDKSETQRVVLEIACLIVVFISPSFLLAVSKKYQDSRDLSAYTTSLQSFVFLNIIVAIYLSHGLKHSFKNSNFTSWSFFRYITSFVLILVFVSGSFVQTGLNFRYIHEQVRNTQVWTLLEENHSQIESTQEGLEIRSSSISRVTRSGEYQFWGYFLDTQDRNFLLKPTDEKYPYRVEAILSDCGYILIQTSFATIVRIYTSDNCDPKILYLKTSSFEFSNEYIENLVKASQNKFSFM